MTCNTNDVILSFLYMESLRKRGALDNATPQMIDKMIEKALEQLKDLAQDREKALQHRKELKGYPAVSFISKDYLNFVDFEEAYSSPIPKAGGLIESVYDIDAIKDVSTVPKSSETQTAYVPPVFSDGMHPDYPERDTTIVTMLTGRAIFDDFKRDITKSNALELLDLSDISEKLEDANISIGEMLEAIEYAHASVYPTDEEMEEIKDEAYLPIRLDNKAILGSLFYKDKIISIYTDKLKKEILKRLSDAPISNLEQLLDEMLSSENNQELFNNALTATQEMSDKYMTVLPELVASSSLKDAKKSIFSDYKLPTAMHVLLTDAGRGTLFEVDCIIDKEVTTLQLLPTGKKTEANITYLDLYISAPSKKDPSRFVHHPLQASRVTLKTNISTEKTSVEVKELMPSEVEVPVNKERNISKAKAYKIEADFPKAFDKVVHGKEMPKRRTYAIDEADQNAGGLVGNIITFMTAQFGSKINVATGTPINGYPESSVNILKMGGSMTLESVNKSQNEFERLYGVYAIESKFLTLLVHGMESYIELSDMIKSIYSNIKTKEKNKSESANIDNLYENGVKDLINVLVEKGLLDQESALSMDIHKEQVSTKIFFDAIEKSEKENRTLEFLSIARNALVNTPALTKKVPKISSLQGFANTFLTVGGKESVSSTDAGIRKELIFTGADINRANFNKEDPRMNMDLFMENNRSGVRVVQALLKAVSMRRFTQEAYVFLTQNYNNMYFKLTATEKEGGKQGRRLREQLLEDIKAEYSDIDINEGELLTLMNKTTSKGSDSFADMYKSYLRQNGSFDGLRKEGDERQELRIKIFEMTLRIFSKLLKKLPAIHDLEKALNDKKDRSGKNKGKEQIEIKIPMINNNENEEKVYDLTGMTFKFSPQFMRGEKMLSVADELINYVVEKNAYPTNMAFSVNIDVCPDDLKPFVRPNENGMRIPYRYELVNKEENQILDVLGSLGIKNQIKEQILTGANVVNISQRVFTNGIATLNYLSALNEVVTMKNNGELTPEQKHIVEKHIENNARLVINYTSDGGDRFNLKELYNNIVRQEGVEVMAVKRDMLDATMKRSVIYDDKAVSLYSHYVSISRGFALDYMHKTVTLPDNTTKKTHTVLNFIDPVGGGNGIQALSRLESPKTDKNIVSLFNGGNDARILFFGENSEKIMDKFVPSSGDMSASTETVHAELAEAASEIIGMAKEDADKLAMNVIAALDLPRPFAITEISLNGHKAQMATETYNSVMEGKSAPMPEYEEERMYLKKPVIDIMLIPDAEEDMSIDVEETQDADAVQDEDVRAILAEIDEKLNLDTEQIEEAYRSQPNIEHAAP